MRKVLIAVSVLSALFAGSAMAENSVSLGYAHSASDGAKLNGVNAKYNYTPDAQPWGVIGSLTLTGGNDSATETDGSYTVKGDVDYGYGSALVGASYAINDVVKPYAMVGVGRSGIKATLKDNEGNKATDKETSDAFAYSVGVQIAPVKNVFIDISYEGSKAFDSQINTFSIGAGYRF